MTGAARSQQWVKRRFIRPRETRISLTTIMATGIVMAAPSRKTEAMTADYRSMAGAMAMLATVCFGATATLSSPPCAPLPAGRGVGERVAYTLGALIGPSAFSIDSPNDNRSLSAPFSASNSKPTGSPLAVMPAGRIRLDMFAQLPSPVLRAIVM